MDPSQMPKAGKRRSRADLESLPANTRIPQSRYMLKRSAQESAPTPSGDQLTVKNEVGGGGSTYQPS